MISYWLYPNPGGADYLSIKVIILFILSVLLFVGSFWVSRWRRRQEGSVTRKLSAGWSSKMRLFAYLGVFLVVCRVEEIQFFALRALWLLWALGLLLYAGIQYWWFRKRHYTVVKTERREDPRSKYLPK